MKKEEKKRMDVILEMLMEIAKGNFSYRIEGSDKKDKIEGLVTTLNMTAEELENSVLHQCYINPNEGFINIAFIFLLLNDEGIILETYGEGSGLLKRDVDELLGSPFIELLNEASKEKWISFGPTMDNDPMPKNHIRLEFKTRDGLLLSLGCNVITLPSTLDLLGSKFIICSGIKIEDDKTLAVMEKAYLSVANEIYQRQGFKVTGILESRKDMIKIRKVTDHLLDNLHKPIGSLIDLARTFGTNEYKLKRGFKYVHGETIYRFVQNERLSMAEVLIKHDDQRIFKIAEICGFRNQCHFSRSFKEKYGESPINYRKRYRTPTSTIKAGSTTVK